MNELPKIVRTRIGAASGGDHPDPDLLNAFAEQALRQPERKQVLAHLSACADCREIVSLAAGSVEAMKATPSLDTGGRHSWFQWRVLRWGAAVACVAIVGSAVLMKRASFMDSGRVQVVASPVVPAEHQLTYEREKSPSPEVSRNQDAAISAAMQPPSTMLTAQNEGRSVGKPAAPKSAPVPTNNGVLDKKVAGNFAARTAGAPARSDLSPAPPAFSNAVTTPAQQESKSLAAQTRNVTDMSVPAAPETVEVEAAAATVDTGSAAKEKDRDKQEAFGKAKPAPAPMPMQFERMADAISETVSTNKAPSKEVLAKGRREQVAAANALMSRWTISSDGTLQHSIDSGKTWQPVVVADRATFRALSANGPDIWVGGPSGLLYHSIDAGAHWIPVRPSAAGVVLNADIAAIEFSDIRHGKISTASGEIWLTEDAGQTWRKQP